MSREGAPFTVEKRHVSELSPWEFEEQYVNRAIPVILRGLVETWPAYDLWSTEWFRRELGDEEVQVAFGKEWKRLKLEEYLTKYGEYEETYRSSGRPSPYLRTWNYADEHPEFETMFDSGLWFRDLFKKFPRRMRPPFSWLFLGPQGTRETLLPNPSVQREEWLYNSRLTLPSSRCSCVVVDRGGDELARGHLAHGRVDRSA